MKSFLLAWLAFSLAAVPGSDQGSEYPAVKYRSNYLSSYYLSHAPTTTPWWPCWSPDGQWIAFSMYGSIWKVNVATDEAYELTHGDRLHSSPAWSPDGKWIVYTIDDNWRAIQLGILNVETGETRPLTQDDQVYVDPVFSPDGKWLAYVTTKPAGNFNVVARPIQNGGWAGPEVAVTRDHDFGRTRLYFSNWDIHIEPAWLKDGSGLLLVSNRDVALGSGNLWRVPFESDAMASGRVILDEQSLFRTRPDVSPDGKRVIYSSTSGAADQYDHLYVLPITGGQPYKLTFGDHDDFHPRWSPDGESIAYISNEGGLPGLYWLETYGGAKRKLVTGKLHWKQPMGTVRVTIRDAETKALLPARISGSASDGRLYAPSTTFVFNARLPGGLKRIFYTPGSYQVEVPPGLLTLEVTKGFEYSPVVRDVTVRAGETVDVTVPLRRRIHLPAGGWFAGTTHTHMNYGGNFHNTPEYLLLMAHGAGLQIVSGLIANKDNRVLDWQYFRKGGSIDPASSLVARSMLIFGEENRPPFWGHTSYIGLRDHLISPFLTGYEGTAVESLYPSNTDLFVKARAEGATTCYVHAFGEESDPLETGLGEAKAFPVDLALGLVDTLEWSMVSRGSLIPLFHAWNNDFRVAPIGGEDSTSNMQDNRPIGILRTYAHLGPNFTAQAWVDALKQGHTFMTSGPLLDFKVNGKLPGEAVSLPAGGPQEVHLDGKVWSVTRLRKVLVYRDGTVWKELHPSGDGFSLSFSEKVSVSGSGWFALGAEGEDQASTAPQVYAQALTNCIRVYVGQEKIRNTESAEYFLKWMAKLRTMTENPDLWRTAAEKQHVFEQFQRAEEVYKQRRQEAKP